ncbi:MAG TPA: response regulator [Candidatus Saccharimonadales bacterium]|nr:response regulator [Candidatus Saccharimonadales bacterium]
MALILIVEDYPSLQKIYSMAVQEAGHEALLAKNGTEALWQVGQRTPDLILLDLLMPEVNGMEFLKQFDLKKHPQTKVIVFTNMDNPTLRTELSALGASLYLTKSEYTPKELMEIVDHTLKTTS